MDLKTYLLLLLVIGMYIVQSFYMSKKNNDNDIQNVNNVSFALSSSFAAIFTLGSVVGELKISSMLKLLFSANKYIFALACLTAIFSVVLPICSAGKNEYNSKIPKAVKENDVKIKKLLLKRKTKINTVSIMLFLFSLAIFLLMIMHIYL